MSLARRAPRSLAGALVLAVIATALMTHPAQADRAIVCANAPAAAFDDVAPGSTHAANIDCVAAYGMTVGVGGGNYDPSGRVSRGQMASFLVNFIEVATDSGAADPSEPAVFDDIAGTTHATNIAVAADLEITVGRTPTSYEPAEDVTRSQMATFVRNAIEAAGGDLPDGVPDAFDDDQGSVHAANIDAIAAAGVVKGVGNGTFEPSGYVTRAQMASFLANAAGLLHEQGVWAAPPLPVEGPQVELVARAGSSMDVIEVRWDDVDTLSATGSDFTILADGGSDAPFAEGTSVAHEGQTSTVELDASLQVDEIYWLEVAAEVAVDPEGDPNEEHRIAFTFAIGDGGDTTGDQDGDGTTDDEDAGTEPAITGVTTDPANEQLVVTFDTEVTCPDGTGGAGAWTFANDSSDGQASGSPDSVTQAGTTSLTCNLVFSTDGVGDGDFGTLSYTQPGGEDDRVRTATDLLLPSTSDVDVVDGVTPTFDEIVGYGGTRNLAATFSEAIACSTVSKSQIEVTVNGADATVDDIGCASPASTELTVRLVSFLAVDDVVVATVVDGTTLSDESLDNQVPSASQTFTVTSE